jgi:hypothetical protein
MRAQIFASAQDFSAINAAFDWAKKEVSFSVRFVFDYKDLSPSGIPSSESSAVQSISDPSPFGLMSQQSRHVQAQGEARIPG